MRNRSDAGWLSGALASAGLAILLSACGSQTEGGAGEALVGPAVDPGAARLLPTADGRPGPGDAAGAGETTTGSVEPGQPDAGPPPEGDEGGTNTGPEPPAAPGEVALTPLEPGLGDTLRCESSPGVEGAGDGAWLETTWLVGGFASPPTGLAQIEALDLFSAPGVPAAKGDVVRCRQRVVVGELASAPGVSNPVTLRNTPPGGGSAVVGPPVVAEGDTLGCMVSSAQDLDGDPVSWSFQWLVNGQPVPGEAGAELTSAWFDKGDEVLCVATPGDGEDDGEAVTSKTAAKVVNTPPAIESVVATPTETTPSGVIACQWSGWIDPDPTDAPLVTYEWERLGAMGVETLAGETGASLAAAALSPGDQVRCVVTPRDDESSGPPVASNLATVLSAGPTCEALATQLDLSVTAAPASILLVVDRSGSMYENWATTKGAVGSVLAGLGPEAQSGLLLYPETVGCSVASAPQVPLGVGQAQAVVDAMDEAGTGGSTPMGRAMRGAREYLEVHGPEGATVILAADGKPSDTCLEDCTGCDCTDAATCMWCADLIECTYNEVRREVEDLNALGVRTFVIGFHGGFGASGFLESLAQAGGTADVGDTPFWDAGDGSALATALTDITDSLQACVATVAVPASYESVQVSVGGAPIAQDPSHVEGFDLDAEGSLRLFGSACESATAPGSTVDVLFSCGP